MKLISSQKMKIKTILFFILLLSFILRFWRLAIVPPGLFGDEVDTGYQAYSLIKTGRDYFGNFFPVHFQSYGDWRVPLYIWIDSLFVSVLGLNEMAVRLPAVLFGVLAVLASFLLAKIITKNEKVALVTSFLVAISPWHIQFSRGAFEAILLTVLFPLAIWFFLKGIQKENKKYLALSACFFGLTPYAYNTPKLLLPIFLVFLFFLFKKEVLKLKKETVIFLAILFLILAPIFWDVFRGPGIARFNSLSIFNDEAMSERVRLSRQFSDLSPSLQRIFYNKGVFWFRDFVNNYLSSFSTEFLFIQGDPNPRHSVGNRGELYLFELPFLLLGLGYLFYCGFHKKDKLSLLVLVFLLVNPIPASLTQKGGQHAIRLLSAVPWLQIVTATGFIFFLENLKKSYRKFFLIFMALISFVSFILFEIYYFDLYPKTAGRWWNYGYREIFQLVNRVEGSYDQIYISSSWEPSLVYTLFYSHYPPEKAQKELTLSSYKIGKYRFFTPDLTPLRRGEGELKTLYVLNPAELEVYGLTLEGNSSLKKIKDVISPDGKGAFVIFSSSDVDLK